MLAFGQPFSAIATELRLPRLGDPHARNVREPRHALRVRKRVEQAEVRSPGVAHERPTFVAPGRAKGLDVRDERVDVDGLDLGAAAAATLFVPVDGRDVIQHVGHRCEVVADPRSAM